MTRRTCSTAEIVDRLIVDAVAKASGEGPGEAAVVGGSVGRRGQHLEADAGLLGEVLPTQCLAAPTRADARIAGIDQHDQAVDLEPGWLV